jgi:mRNA interferase MazF
LIRGGVHRLVLPRGTGHEQRGPRYGVIVQADGLLGLSTVIIAPTSTNARPASFRPVIDVDGVETRVLVEQMRAVDTGRIGSQVRVLSVEEQQHVDDALEIVLDL